MHRIIHWSFNLYGLNFNGQRGIMYILFFIRIGTFYGVIDRKYFNIDQFYDEGLGYI